MKDCVLDTNVLLVASAAHPYSPWDDANHVPAEEQKAVFDWLAEFRADSERAVVFDDLFAIYEEYRNKLTDQDFGLQVVTEKMHQALMRQVELEREDDGTPVVPTAFRNFDRSDRKFLAAALSDPATIAIVNAADTDWLYFEKELDAAGVKVVHVIEGWLREQKANK